MTAPASSRPTWLTLRLGEHGYATAMQQIVKVAEIDALHPLPGDLECNLGLAVHQGVVAGVLDLEVLLEMRAARRRPTTPFTCVFGRFARGIAGFPVDALLGLERSSGDLRIIDLGLLEAAR